MLHPPYIKSYLRRSIHAPSNPDWKIIMEVCCHTISRTRDQLIRAIYNSIRQIQDVVNRRRKLTRSPPIDQNKEQQYCYSTCMYSRVYIYRLPRYPASTGDIDLLGGSIHRPGLTTIIGVYGITSEFSTKQPEWLLGID